MATELGSHNIWTEWVPEETLRAVLAGEEIIVDIGQVNDLWRQMLNREITTGRIVKWRGKWFPIPGARSGLGPDKTCYGTQEARDLVLSIPA